MALVAANETSSKAPYAPRATDSKLIRMIWLHLFRHVGRMAMQHKRNPLFQPIE